MITGTIISNGKQRLILTAETPLEEEFLKIMDGATCKFITDNLRLFDKTVSHGIVIEVEQKK